MILSDRDLRKLISEGVLGIDPLKDSQIGPTSIDLHLGSVFVRYDTHVIELGRTLPESVEIEVDALNGYTLNPGDFVLGCTLERLRIPNGYQGFIETKGNAARAGLLVHNCDGHIDPGNDNIITLELSNMNSIPIVLYPNILICQLFVHTLSSQCDQVYQGKYYGQTKPTIYRP